MEMPATQMTYFPLKGGLDLITPPVSRPDGSCREALNFECVIEGGYRRVAGYERFDGTTPPSKATFSSLPIANYSNLQALQPGAFVIGQVSSASGFVLKAEPGVLYLTNTNLQFALGGEPLLVGPSVVATSSGGLLAFGATDAKSLASLKTLAANTLRQNVSPVPGTGPVRGVCSLHGTVYAIRDAVEGLSANLFRSSAAGWVQVELHNEVMFSNADALLAEGTLTQGPVSANILKVVVESGSLQSGVNSGKLIVENPSGGSFSAGAATTIAGAALTLTGANEPITLAPGGLYEFHTHNFYGGSSSMRLYGASGTHKAFEFDGQTLSFITTGLEDDKPSHVTALSGYLWLSYKSSVLRSSVGDPHRFESITGALEIASGDEVTALVPITGSSASAALAVLTKNRTLIAYGSTESDFQLVSYNDEAGAFERTAQSVGDVFMLDTFGVRKLSATQAYGNFADAHTSYLIQPWLKPRLERVVGSCVSRSKSQYRLFFSDGSALYVTFNNGKVIGMMPVLTKHVFNTFWSRELPDGEELILAGGTDGYVYRLDSGTSCDGFAMEYSLYLSFSHMKGPRVRKHWRKAVYEVSGDAYGEFEAGYEIGYTNPDINQGVFSTVQSGFSPVAWDNFFWDNFYWDGRSLVPLEQKLYGTAENISIVVRGSSADYEPFTINSVILQYTPRRQLR